MYTALTKINLNLARSLSAISLHKAVQVAGVAATVALVPRLFGAEDYGRFAFVLSLSYLGQILGDFGTLDVMGKFVPGLTHIGSGRLYMQHLALKWWVGLLCGLITAGTALLLTNWMRPSWAVMVGLGVALHILAWVPYQFSLGLNRVGTWMSEQAWRQWVLLVLLLLLLPLFGLTGALLALLIMEIVFLGLGIWVARDYWTTGELIFDWSYLRPYLRFGLGFFMANLVAVTLYRSGPLLVEILTGQSTETGYFNLALGLFMMVYITTGQFAQSLIPALSGFHSQGQTGTIRTWLKNYVSYGWLLTGLAVLLIWFTADWVVPLVFGAEFLPAAQSLKWISLGMPPAVLLWATSVLATVMGKGRLKFAASLIALVVFCVMAILLTPNFGAAGAAAALGSATVVNALIMAARLRKNVQKLWV